MSFMAHLLQNSNMVLLDNLQAELPLKYWVNVCMHIQTRSSMFLFERFHKIITAVVYLIWHKKWKKVVWCLQLFPKDYIILNCHSVEKNKLRAA